MTSGKALCHRSRKEFQDAVKACIVRRTNNFQTNVLKELTSRKVLAHSLKEPFFAADEADEWFKQVLIGEANLYNP